MDKPCVSCAHYRRELHEDRCGVAKDVDLVTGKPYMRQCSIERYSYGDRYCGQEGKHWQPIMVAA